MIETASKRARTRMVDETRKANRRRIHDPIFARVFRGRGIDIGAGDDILVRDRLFPRVTSCESFDSGDGDEERIDEFRDAGSYDFVYSSHRLEHLQNPGAALSSWFRLARPSGYLVVVVPDEDLYEQGVFPSRFDPDHKWTFTAWKDPGSSWSPKSLNLWQMIHEHLCGFRVLSIRVADSGYNYSLSGIDQTLDPDGPEAGIELVLQKHPFTPAEPTSPQAAEPRSPVFLHSSIAGCLGDRIAFLSAARLWARRHPGCVVSVDTLHEIVIAFDDDLLRIGRIGIPIDANAALRHRRKKSSPDRNYVGTYYAALGGIVDQPPRIELPSFPCPGTLREGSYVALQPYSGYAQNPAESTLFVQGLVDTCRKELPKTPIICVGHPTTPQDVNGVDYEHLGESEQLMFSVIQHSRFVLSPRSASAHIASGYRKSAFLWLPEDGENWHLEYPDWPRQCVRIELSPIEAASRFREWLWCEAKSMASKP